ncbi:MAG: hypothetical protein ACI8PQ_001698 [Planctomycetota bacterium]|jgi:hypothetical protein
MDATDRTDVDSPRGRVLEAAWRALSHRTAVAGACAAAIVSLQNHVPLSTAALRGGATWFVVLVTARLGWFALVRALAIEARRDEQEGDASGEA